jgi:hypothetical protein
VRPEHTDYKFHEAEIVRVNTIRRYLELEFRQLAASLPFVFDIERIIDDFVLCCSLVGNDFLPHLPSIRIYDGALDLIFECYKLILPECSGYLTRDCKVDLKAGGLAKLMRRIGKLEDSIFDANEKKRPRRYAPENSPWRERPVGNSQRRDAQVEAFLRDPDAVAIRWPMKELSKQEEARLMVGVSLPDLQCWVDNDGQRKGHVTLIKPGAARRLLEQGKVRAAATSAASAGESKAVAGVDIMEELRAMLSAGEISQTDFNEAAAEKQAEDRSNISVTGETFGGGDATTRGIVQRAASKFFKNEVLAAIEQATGVMKKSLAKNDSSSLRLHNPQHRLEYYRRFFDECLPEKKLPKGTSPESIADSVASEYVRGMCWALEYYLHDCPSWGWLFPYHFAPLAQDMAAALTKQGTSTTLATFDGSVGPTSSISQLLCVLPRSSAPAVPNADAQKLMCDPASPLAASFETKMSYDTRGESRKWKWTAVFPFASPDQVMKAIVDKGVHETPHGVERVYMRKDHPIAIAARKGGGNDTESYLQFRESPSAETTVCAMPISLATAAGKLALLAGVLSGDGGHARGGGGATAAGAAAVVEEFIYTPRRADIHSREHGNTLPGVKLCPVAATLRANDVKSGKAKAKKLLGSGSGGSGHHSHGGGGHIGGNGRAGGTSGACRHWQKTGSCSYGDRCRFSHSTNGGGGGGGGGGRICSYFKQNGTCRFGDKCRFSHGNAGSSGSNTQICFQFQQEGACGYGERCRYSHDVE